MVTNLINENGNATANQFVIFDENGVTFQSYRTKIAVIGGGEVKVSYQNWDYSKTTTKYLYQFLRQNGISVHSKGEFLKLVKDGKIQWF